MIVEPITQAPGTEAASRLPEAVVVRTALATLRRHAASPLTGTPPFWERLVRTVLESYIELRISGVPTLDQVTAVAERARPAFAASPVTNSDILWRSIVDTVLVEYLAPSGNGEPTPRFVGNQPKAKKAPWRTP